MQISRRIAQLAESATLAVSAKAAQMKAAGIDVVSMAAGEPDFDTPDHIKEAGIQAIRDGKTKYGKPASGLPEAKAAACLKLERDNGLLYEPSQIIITAGAKNAVQMTFMSVLEPGDEVIIPSPYWVVSPWLRAPRGAQYPNALGSASLSQGRYTTRNSTRTITA